jgi:deoxyxylulose-5-phosphate synthase
MAIEPGLHFMALSQKNMKNICAPSQLQVVDYDEALIYKYLTDEEKPKIAVVFFGVNNSIAHEISQELSKKNYCVNLINIIKLSKIETSSKLFYEITQHDKIIVIDTGKSKVHFSTELVLNLKENGNKIDLYQRDASQMWSVVSDDAIEFNTQSIVQKITKGI